MRDEAISLIESAGALYAGTIFQKIRDVNPATYIGPGKLQELRERLDGLDVTVLFNGDLTPSQTLNISAALDNKKVIDRTTLILDIFANNARSGEGKLQVELAQLQYMYPRLKGKGEGLSRLAGGIGTRGPGETKLETDRRRIRVRIAYLKDRLRVLENRRELVNTRRVKESARRIALVGYTNTGKSTLLNLLTGAEVAAEDRLFARSTLRRGVLPSTASIFCSPDTVGFLRALPHNLISAFHSTLESALNCALALIVCDATSDYRMQYETTLETLKELKCEVPYRIVMNKCESIDCFDEYPHDAIFISAHREYRHRPPKTGNFKPVFRRYFCRKPAHPLYAHERIRARQGICSRKRLPLFGRLCRTEGSHSEPSTCQSLLLFASPTARNTRKSDVMCDIVLCKSLKNAFIRLLVCVILLTRR